MNVSPWLNYSSGCDCRFQSWNDRSCCQYCRLSLLLPLHVQILLSHVCVLFSFPTALLPCSDLVTADLTASFQTLRSAGTASMPNKAMPPALRSHLQTSLEPGPLCRSRASGKLAKRDIFCRLCMRVTCPSQRERRSVSIENMLVVPAFTRTRKIKQVAVASGVDGDALLSSAENITQLQREKDAEECRGENAALV